MLSMGRKITEKFEEKFELFLLDRDSKGKSVVRRERERERDRLSPVSKVHAVEAVESTFIGCKFTGAITGRYNAGY